MALNQKATINFTGSAKITGLPVSSANGEPVVHEQLTPLIGGLVYKGSWNATTNVPAIPAAAVGNKGHYYVVGTAGATSINGITDWAATDWIVSNGTAWEKVDNYEGALAAASETVAGVAELATNAEAITGTDTTRVVTPANLAAVLTASKFSETFGGTASSVITHNLNTLDVICQVREVATNDVVGVDVQATSVNTVTVTFAAATAANSHRITIQK